MRISKEKKRVEMARKREARETYAPPPGTRHLCPESLARGAPLQSSDFSKTLPPFMWT